MVIPAYIPSPRGGVMPHITPQIQGSIAAASNGSQPTCSRTEMNADPKITTEDEPGITMPIKQVIAQIAITDPNLPKFQEVIITPNSSAIFNSAIAQIMLKKSAQKKSEYNIFTFLNKYCPNLANKLRNSDNKLLVLAKRNKSLLSEYLNLFTMIAYTVFIIATFLTIFSYKVIPLSAGPILGASEYIFVAVLSRVILKEKVSKRKLIGLCVIIIGVLVFSFDFSILKGLFL